MEQQPAFWKKRILVPFWILRICIMIFIIAAYAYTLRTLKDLKDVTEPAVGTTIIYILFIVIVLLIDVLAILFFLRDALKPANFLSMNCFQTGFWFGVLIVDFVSYHNGGVSSVRLGFAIFVFLTFLVFLIYSIIAYRRAKAAAQRGHYAPAHNPATQAPDFYSTPYTGLPDYQHQSTAYHSQTNPLTETHNQYLPPYQTAVEGDYYQQQPMKPAHIV
ncbi:cys met metabolism pyridoxal phosphate-dependent enzyme [Stemphylium lycopersici]|uniref:Cys met metabolism pyridoxal phosphate-dependent enzyme n=1 Tax=Stemphylium lycopersici TaxID=183478 RepID=A0A364NH09_STELY|nr:cys met metabolism pyridoxal phosphate-dependent enzyme [Stemphylium lycopersici]